MKSTRERNKEVLREKQEKTKKESVDGNDGIIIKRKKDERSKQLENRG
jgi:hypothetical protein